MNEPLTSQKLDLSIVIPTLNEQGNIGPLVGRCKTTLAELDITYEIIAVDGGSKDNTVNEAEEAGARAIQQEGRGYGGALRTGFKNARGQYIQTMDSDLSHEPEVIAQLWAAREKAEVTIASRYVEGGGGDMPIFRAVLSKILNVVFTTLLSIPVKDISSGFRLYKGDTVRAISFEAEDFDVLEEILIVIYVGGGRVAEVPFQYRPRQEGKSNAKLFKFAIAYLKTLYSMWKLRRSG